MYKKLILIIIATSVGSFALEIFEKTSLNIWISRSLGGLVSVLSILLLYKIFMKEK
ncbi:MAG: hypothetical protein JXR88_06875 [Clostridia bacterium]|nr:hypothetical protein [Clostridia bacterium]